MLICVDPPGGEETDRKAQEGAESPPTLPSPEGRAREDVCHRPREGSNTKGAEGNDEYEGEEPCENLCQSWEEEGDGNCNDYYNE